MDNKWKKYIKDELKKSYFLKLKEFIINEYKNNICFPKKKYIFSSFFYSFFDKIKVIIIGQDPYHGYNQANGLSFSVKKNMILPPSLKNIFKEIFNDIGKISICSDGDLTPWAKQDILLLNSILTVRAFQPGSHKNKGWEIFTNEIIKKLSNERNNLVFLLWGLYAIKKKYLIDKKKHFILFSSHPSPLSVNNGFFGCRHFSKTNYILMKNKKSPINW